MTQLLPLSFGYICDPTSGQWIPRNSPNSPKTSSSPLLQINTWNRLCTRKCLLASNDIWRWSYSQGSIFVLAEGYHWALHTDGSTMKAFNIFCIKKVCILTDTINLMSSNIITNISCPQWQLFNTGWFVMWLVTLMKSSLTHNRILLSVSWCSLLMMKWHLKQTTLMTNLGSLATSISFERKVPVMGFIKAMWFAPQLDGLRRAVRHLNMVRIMMVIGQVNFLSSRYFNSCLITNRGILTEKNHTD